MDTLATQLSALLSTGGSRNRLVLTSGDIWLALSGEKGGTAVTCEAVTDDHLPGSDKLTAQQRQSLMAAGFTPIKHSSRLQRRYDLEGQSRPGEVAAALTGLLQEVYGVSTWTLTATTSSAHEETNPQVIRQMRQLSRSRSHQDRVNLYRSLLRATLLVPVESAQSQKPAVIGDISGFEVFGAFTDQKSALYYDPRGVPLRAVGGRELFPMLMKLRAGSLRLNPGAVVGGELYRNELESIAGAAVRVTLR